MGPRPNRWAVLGKGVLLRRRCGRPLGLKQLGFPLIRPAESRGDHCLAQRSGPSHPPSLMRPPSGSLPRNRTPQTPSLPFRFPVELGSERDLDTQVGRLHHVAVAGEPRMGPGQAPAESLLWMGHTVTEQQLKAPGTQTDVLLADLHHCRPAGELTAASAPMPCSWCGQARLKWATWSTGASCNSPGCGPGPGPCPAAVGSPGPLGSTGCRRATPGEAQAQGFPSPLNCTHGCHLS
ncbi:uncharacterized protein [Chlorocebus sabaeus]|uniref:uncharacterized protein n=1 Tax=Chlorocebus sabaeus TaxID=60711 RepID=UPI003BF9BDF7